MLEYFQGDSNNEFVVLAREKLEVERRRLEALKSPQERLQDLDQKIAQVRNAVGNKTLALAKAHQEAQAAQNRVDQLEGEPQASLEEVKNLEVQQDHFKSQLPTPRPQAPQEESPEERDCANTIAFLMEKGGDTAHVQQTINELQDKYLRLAAKRTRTQAVHDDSLEHGLPNNPPWPLQEGSTIRQTVITQGSLATQRHVVHYCQSKGKGTPANARRTGKGKGHTTDVRAAAATPEANLTDSSTSSSSPSSATPSSATPSAAPPTSTTPSASDSQQTPPWREPPDPTPAAPAQVQAVEMEDHDGPERGAKRPAEAAADVAEEAAPAVRAEEDEFQEAARYGRGDGHLA